MSDPLGTLKPGAESFVVEEIPAYEPSGSGEHLYVQVEATGLTTDACAERLARACGVPASAVGYAGRKDRHAITRQWFSIHGGQEDPLSELDVEGLVVLRVDRHRNKLKRGHLRGNRFRLTLELRSGAQAELRRQLDRIGTHGLPNRFGPQRFGLGGSNLDVARAWGRGEPGEAVARVIDPEGGWAPGDALPERRLGGFAGRALATLRRKPDDYAGALRAPGRAFRQLIASAAQSAIFNAVFDARRDAGLLHTLREGDVARTPRGGSFVCAEADLEDANRRAAPGTLELFTTGPMPGRDRMRPSDAVAAEEFAWAAPAAIDPAWLGPDGALASTGERRALLVRCLEPPAFEPAVSQLVIALPKGSYATELLRAVGIELPADRSGRTSAPRADGPSDTLST